jgi:hypothetical protein
MIYMHMDEHNLKQSPMSDFLKQQLIVFYLQEIVEILESWALVLDYRLMYPFLVTLPKVSYLSGT